MKRVKAYAPASLANCNIGFDVVGVSLTNPGDTVELFSNGTQQNVIKSIINGDNLPTSVEKNVCAVVIRSMQEALKEYIGVDIILEKGFASGSGMGSSSASCAAAAMAYNELVGCPFSIQELVRFAGEGEKVASGSLHYDNVAPSVLGGLQLIPNNNPDYIQSLPIPPNLFAVTVFPQIEIQTKQSREMLPEYIPLSQAKQQISFMGAWVSSLYQNDVELFSYAFKDVMIEPIRKNQIPFFDELQETALSNGALGFGISGSGPTVFAICLGRDIAIQIEKSLQQVFTHSEISIETNIHPLQQGNGAKIIDRE